ncbi:MAG: hypothetical protein AB7O32_13820 [Vicinamibacterales bacterium]
MRRWTMSVSIVALLSMATSAAAPHASSGRVQLVERALADDGGPFNALGASLFWALWAERHDPERLDANLAWLAERNVDFVRVFAMVGAESWSDRRIDPRAPGYWESVDGLLARLSRHGLRVQLTMFADAQVMMPDRAERRRFAERWADRAAREPERFVLIEVANEHWQNGLTDVEEVRTLARVVAGRTDVLVALSATQPEKTCALYAGSGADVATVHYPRRGGWPSVVQPWRWPADFDRACPGDLPVAVNSEPIGPGSSVNDENDPARLVMAYVTTFVSQNAAYVLHAGAGVRGGGSVDRAAGRRANLFDVGSLDAALRGIRAAREYLPAGLANWDRHAAAAPSHPFAGFDAALARGLVTAAPAATSRDRFVVAVLGLTGPVDVRPRRACTVDVREPLSAHATRHELGAGEPLRVSGGEAFVLIGSCR